MAMVGHPSSIVLAWLPDFGAWDPPSWSALAAWVTATTAVAAAVFAWRSVEQAKKTREAQAQPYVAVFIEPSESNPQHVYLVIKNFGNTAAINVEVDIEPAPVRTGHPDPMKSEPVEYPASLRALVPRQDWRTLWDFSPERLEVGLPDKHVATVNYASDGGSTYSYSYDLDWSENAGRLWITRYTVHDSAKALREIAKETKKWRESANGGLKVYVRDGAERDRRIEERRRKAGQASSRLENMVTVVPDEEYRRMTGEQEAGEQEAGEQEAGEQEAGEQEAGEQEAGEQEAGEQDEEGQPDG